ncbi:MAG TPA: tyrosine/phenylalanine carboxypeptidase domain-containing protein [Bdellovibrionota bacterium]|nr:tyrosine/phenylalanine carboxypeptidase domain-containing protein [Bdellovibrionota bacterium]
MNPEDKNRKADDLMAEISHEFSLFDAVNPLNHAQERERFLKAWERGEAYNPRYEYRLLPPDLPKLKKRLSALDFGTSVFDKMFDELRTEWQRTLAVADARGTLEVTKRSQELYGEPSAALAKEAQAALEESAEAKEESPDVGVKGLAEKMRERLRQDRIEGWDVIEDPTTVMLAHVDAAHRRIRLQAGMIVTSAMVERLLHHEIQVHVYRTANGERQPFKAFALGFGRWLETEEGLAVSLEERLGDSIPSVRRRYAGRVIAASLASTKSFFDIFAKLVESFSPEEAFTLTQRSKRGLEDTSHPGGFVQDHIYLQGKKRIADLKTEDLRLLYSGKIAVHHLPVVRELIAQHKLMDPAFLPSPLYG